MAQDEVLEYLAKQYPNKPTQREMAKALGITAPSLNEQLQRLERKGLVFAEGEHRNKRYVASPAAAKELSTRVDRLELKLDRLERRHERLRTVVENITGTIPPDNL